MKRRKKTQLSIRKYVNSRSSVIIQNHRNTFFSNHANTSLQDILNKIEINENISERKAWYKKYIIYAKLMFHKMYYFNNIKSLIYKYPIEMEGFDKDKTIISFSGSGALGPFYYGIIYNLFWDLDPEKHIFVGTSGGIMAIIAFQKLLYIKDRKIYIKEFERIIKDLKLMYKVSEKNNDIELDNIVRFLDFAYYDKDRKSDKFYACLTFNDRPILIDTSKYDIRDLFMLCGCIPGATFNHIPISNNNNVIVDGTFTSDLPIIKNHDHIFVTSNIYIDDELKDNFFILNNTNKFLTLKPLKSFSGKDDTLISYGKYLYESKMKQIKFNIDKLIVDWESIDFNVYQKYFSDV